MSLRPGFILLDVIPGTQESDAVAIVKDPNGGIRISGHPMGDEVALSNDQIPKLIELLAIYLNTEKTDEGPTVDDELLNFVRKLESAGKPR